MDVKRIFLLVLLSTLSISVSAQNADSLLLDNFKQSVIKRFDYPNELVKRCSGTSVVLKINVNAKGDVVDMKLSDSADPFFVIEWLSKEKEMDVISLKRYIKSRLIVNTNVLLPISYMFKSNICGLSLIDPYALQHLYQFEKKQLTGSTYLLSPLNFEFRSVTTY